MLGKQSENRADEHEELSEPRIIAMTIRQGSEYLNSISMHFNVLGCFRKTKPLRRRQRTPASHRQGASQWRRTVRVVPRASSSLRHLIPLS